TIWRCRDRTLRCERTLIMGILNITPDSFSDGGNYFDLAQAVVRGLKLADEGADIIDVGGESTRPGAATVDEAEELRRVVPVIRTLAERTNCAISVDTTKASVARAALQAGAQIINDISAATWDEAMAATVAEFQAGVVLMHCQGTPETMQQEPQYNDVVAEVREFLSARMDALVEAGLPRENMAVDPGFGFGKTLEHNLTLLRQLDQFTRLGRPILVGLSRKSMLGTLTGQKRPEHRVNGGLAAVAAAILRGARLVRTHDVAATRDAVRVADELRVYQT
ncbi:MAG: dihydropteroate synthase, partial [Kiritimatiellaeota bacterium]|nr:dihydropteroate synthase [Kiritimatiellota bacterium]